VATSSILRSGILFAHRFSRCLIMSSTMWITPVMPLCRILGLTNGYGHAWRSAAHEHSMCCLNWLCVPIVPTIRCLLRSLTSCQAYFRGGSLWTVCRFAVLLCRAMGWALYYTEFVAHGLWYHLFFSVYGATWTLACSTKLSGTMCIHIYLYTYRSCGLWFTDRLVLTMRYDSHICMRAGHLCIPTCVWFSPCSWHKSLSVWPLSWCECSWCLSM